MHMHVDLVFMVDCCACVCVCVPVWCMDVCRDVDSFPFRQIFALPIRPIHLGEVMPNFSAACIPLGEVHACV